MINPYTELQIDDSISIYAKAYYKGTEDAWECMKDILTMPAPEYEKIFGDSTTRFCTIRDYTALELMKKLHDYYFYKELITE